MTAPRPTSTGDTCAQSSAATVLLALRGGCSTPREIERRTGLPKGTVSAALVRLVHAGRATRSGRGVYAPAEAPLRLVDCSFCAWSFEATRSDADCCSTACRMAKLRALDPDYTRPDRPQVRRDSVSREREAATGWGLMTPREQYAADVRVRQAAGLPVEVVDESWLVEPEADARFRAEWQASFFASKRTRPTPACPGPIADPARSPARRVA